MINLNMDVYGVEAMSKQEMQNENGGIGIIGTIVAGLVIAAGVQIMDDWDNFKAGLAGEAEIKK